MKNENKTKIVWDKDFFIYNKRYHWFIIPTFVFFYSKEVFLETGVYTPAWGFTFRWLTIMIGVQFQKSYEILKENE
mgnify:CR=1 FL=1|jgi:hypothetical protein